MCLSCKAIEKGKRQPGPHLCFKNWNSASTSMESDIIVEGMNYFYEVGKVKCTRLIGDGDANTLSKVREQVPYGMEVEKVECANHTVRRYGRALAKIVADTKAFTRQEGVSAHKEMRLRMGRLITGARSAIKRHAISSARGQTQEAVEKLQTEFRNGPSHVFGSHENCGDFCTRKEKDESKNETDLMIKTGVMEAVLSEVERVLCAEAKTLLWNNTNNPAENFMSQMSKATGGKCVNHSKCGGINRRSTIDALAYQARGQGWHGAVHRRLVGQSPRSPLRRFMLQRAKRNLRFQACRKRLAGTRRRTDHIDRGGDQNYGDNPTIPDKTPAEYDEAVGRLREGLKVQDRYELSPKTIGQATNKLWLSERRKRISSTQFKDISSRQPSTLTANIVRKIVYGVKVPKRGKMKEALDWGTANEPTARQKYRDMHPGVPVEECGLVVDPKHPFLCTSPDGLVSSDGLLEIKCPVSAKKKCPLSKKEIGVVGASKSSDIGVKFCTKTNAWILPKSGHYYSQIQGQLAITDRAWCDLFLWSPVDHVLIRVERNREHFAAILPKLQKFFDDSLLPEIVDPRARRKMKLREPDYVLEAVKRKEEDTAKRKATSHAAGPSQKKKRTNK